MDTEKQLLSPLNFVYIGGGGGGGGGGGTRSYKQMNPTSHPERYLEGDSKIISELLSNECVSKIRHDGEYLAL